MATYFPIQLKVAIKASESDMVALYWRHNALVADFIIPGDKFSYLRVFFAKVCIVRTLDEMPMSTEEEIRQDEGTVPDHLAYRVEGSHFWEAQSPSFRSVFNDTRHYRFITGWTCLDVLANVPPVFTIVPADSGPGKFQTETVPKSE